jgi:phage-related holin
MERGKNVVFDMISWVIVFLTPVFHVGVAVLFLMLLNFYTGYKKNKITKNLDFDTEKAKKGVRDFTMYILAIVAAHLYDRVFLNTFDVPLAKICAGGISIIQLKSIFDNIAVITGVNLWTIISDKLTVTKNEKRPDNNEQN